MIITQIPSLEMSRASAPVMRLSCVPWSNYHRVIPAKAGISVGGGATTLWFDRLTMRSTWSSTFQ
jgi:hypothetical protein